MEFERKREEKGIFSILRITSSCFNASDSFRSGHLSPSSSQRNIRNIGMVETGTSSKNANSGGVYGNIKSLAIVLALQEQISNKKASLHVVVFYLVRAFYGQERREIN